MATLIVPRPDPEPWPTLGPQIEQFLVESSIYGPGSLKGQPYKLDPQFRAWLYRAYEVYPQWHQWPGRRRFKRAGYSVRKGLSKCLHPDTPVLLSSGLEKRAADVHPGDVALAYEGGSLSPARVSHTEVQPAVPMYRITTERGRELTVTAEHPLLVRGTRMLPGVARRRRFASCDPDRDREQWVPAAELILGDRVVVGLGWEGVGELDEDEAWVLGAIVGDGGGDGRFTTADPEILTELMRHFRVTALSGGAGYDYYLRGAPRFLREHGLFGCNARAKRVPPSVQVAAPGAVASFMAGYFDTDGWASYSERPKGKTYIAIAWGSVNRPLLQQCQVLLAGLGFNAVLEETRGTYKGERHQSWNLAVRDTVQAARLADVLLKHSRHLRKRERLGELSEHPHGRVFAHRDTDKVRSIEALPSAESIAIEVEGLHTHVTAGLVTHNTEGMAQIAYAELHPDAPVRCDGFDAHGNPVGRPVMDPYIPLLAVTVEQVEELAYGALYVLCTEGPDSDLFDCTLDRIIRLSPTGRADGKAVALSNSPGARDGARTTFQGFDEPHRLFLPRQVQAHETMAANLSKRVLEDPWALYVGTAGEPGQESVAEGIHAEAIAISEGKIKEPRLFYLHREAGPGYDMHDFDQRVKAVEEATGPIGEYGPGQFHDIASQWDRPQADKKYLERTWLNRWTRSEEQAFDVKQREKLRQHDIWKPGRFVVAGMDGARFRDSTGIVLTDITTGRQKLWAVWERPPDKRDDDTWEIDEAEVTASVEQLMTTHEVWRFNVDPPHWTETVGSWAGRWECVEEWWTTRKKPMALAIRAYEEALATGAISFAYETVDPDEDRHEKIFARHAAAAGREEVNLWDDEGRRMYVLRKLHADRRFDVQMAAILSWDAYLAALAKPAQRRRRSTIVQRLR